MRFHAGNPPAQDETSAAKGASAELRWPGRDQEAGRELSSARSLPAASSLPSGRLGRTRIQAIVSEPARPIVGSPKGQGLSWTALFPPRRFGARNACPVPIPALRTLLYGRCRAVVETFQGGCSVTDAGSSGALSQGFPRCSYQVSPARKCLRIWTTRALPGRTRKSEVEIRR